MYSVKIVDHIMIAHSLPDPYFGPASNMHGATYVVTASFKRKQLNDKNVVIDMGEAHELLQDVLSELAYRNLDEMPQFEGILTTTEFLSSYIHRKVRDRIEDDISLEIELSESHIASASFQD